MKTILWILFFTGFAIFGYSIAIDKYADQKAANNLLNKYYEDNNEENYFKKLAELETCKNDLEDLGTGVCTFTLTLIIFLNLKKIKKVVEIRNLEVSLRAIPLFIKFNTFWLLQIIGTHWYYYLRAFRGDFPPFADSIGIPIYAQVNFIFYSLIFVNIILTMLKYKTHDQVLIYHKVENYNSKLIIWEVVFSLLIILNLLLLILFILDGDHFSIIIFTEFLYLLLALRAGKLIPLTTGRLMPLPFSLGKQASAN